MTGVCACVLLGLVIGSVFCHRNKPQRHQLSLSPIALSGAALQLITRGVVSGGTEASEVTSRSIELALWKLRNVSLARTFKT